MKQVEDAFAKNPKARLIDFPIDQDFLIPNRPVSVARTRPNTTNMKLNRTGFIKSNQNIDPFLIVARYYSVGHKKEEQNRFDERNKW